MRPLNSLRRLNMSASQGRAGQGRTQAWGQLARRSHARTGSSSGSYGAHMHSSSDSREGANTDGAWRSARGDALTGGVGVDVPVPHIGRRVLTHVAICHQALRNRDEGGTSRRIC